LESRCRESRLRSLENKYGNDPRFKKAMQIVYRLYDEASSELEYEKPLMDCYGQRLDMLRDILSKATSERVELEYARLKSDLFSTSMAFFSSFSEQMTQFLRKAKMSLRNLPTQMKTSLVNLLRDFWIEQAYPLLQKFVDKLDVLAKKLKVDSYSVSMDIAFINVSFAFKPAFSNTAQQ
jgi:RNAse (barnase) inhibitor barstar